MSTSRIGLIGGISWESTAEYYRLFNQMVDKSRSPHNQPRLLIDSLDFAEIVVHQESNNWAAIDDLVIESAQRLVAGGASVLAIGANTIHKSYEAAMAAVSVPIIDVREAVANEVKRLGKASVALLGTKYTIQGDFYSNKIESLGVRVVKPTEEETNELQKIIYEELTRGIFLDTSRRRFIEIAQRCVAQGAEAVGLCCTEFGSLLGSVATDFVSIDSTVVHVAALLAASE